LPLSLEGLALEDTEPTDSEDVVVDSVSEPEDVEEGADPCELVDS